MRPETDYFSTFVLSVTLSSKQPMKRLIYLRTLVLVFIIGAFSVSLYSKDKVKKLKMPSAERMQAINDSILEEGLRLYAYESTQWQAADSLMKYGTRNIDRIDGTAMMAVDDHTWKFIYVSLASREVLFEYTLDTNTNKGKWCGEVRPITLDEERLANVKRTVQTKAIELKGDSIRLTSTEGLNWDCVPLLNGGYRLYLLRGTTRNDVQPIGDDYSFDFDARLNLTSWRRYHRTFLEIPTVVEGRKMSILIHSHTDLTPYVTPTDIANFMLYGYNLYGITQMYVLQTAFKEDYYTVFDVGKMQLISLSAKVMEKMMGK